MVAVAGYFTWRALAPREGTDDAQVSGHVSPVATRVGGTVLAIKSSTTSAVKAGDVLVELDPRDYQLAVAKAEADLAAAQAAARASHSDVPITSSSARSGQQVAQVATGNADAGLRAADREIEASRAKVASAEARLEEHAREATRASQDLERLAPLAAKDEIPASAARQRHGRQAGRRRRGVVGRRGRPRSQANLDVADARRAQAEGMVPQSRSQAQAAATAPQQIALIEARASGADAQVMLAKAALDQARLNLERTVVKRPRGRPRQPPHRRSRPGRSAGPAAHGHHLAARRVGDGEFQGDAAPLDDAPASAPKSKSTPSAAAATRAASIRLPPPPARRSACCRRTTRRGNFVKVVQRVPVKIVLDAAHRRLGRAAAWHVGQRDGLPALTARLVMSQSLAAAAAERPARRRRPSAAPCRPLVHPRSA